MLVFQISKKISVFFGGLKDMLTLFQNKRILQVLATPSRFPMAEAAESEVQAFVKRNHGKTEEDAVIALESDPKALRALAIAGGVSSEAFQGAIVELKDAMGEQHEEAMAMVEHYGEQLAAGQQAIRAEIGQVKKGAFSGVLLSSFVPFLTPKQS